MKSCGYALYLVTSSIQSAADILEKNEIDFRGAYEIGDTGGKNVYRRVL